MTTAEAPNFDWPEKFDPSRELIIDLDSCIIIAKQIRLTKPKRDLSALAPRSTEINSFFQLRDVYKMHVEPYGKAGSHYHHEKIEIVYPLADLQLFFLNPETGKTIAVRVPERINDTCFGFLVKPGIVHTIKNPSQVNPVFYLVLSNRFEEEAEKTGDIIPYEFGLPDEVLSIRSLIDGTKKLAIHT